MARLVRPTLPLLPVVRVDFIRPNFELEWEAASKLSNIFHTKAEWLRVCRKGRAVRLTGREVVVNTDYKSNANEMKNLAFDSMKVSRVLNRFEKRKPFEYPIVMKVGDHYELISGNVRLVYLWLLNLPRKVWMIEPHS